MADATRKPVPLTSHAVVYGICVRINRSRNDATLQLHDGETCRVEKLSDEQLRQLMPGTGEDLEQVYRVEGEGTWRADDYRIRQIEVSSIQPVERDAEKLFDTLRDATGDRFEDVDPIDYVDSMRGK